MASAPTTPVSWVLAPAASATGVRDELLLIGKPRKNAAARLAIPRPTISWFGSTGLRRRAAYVRESTLVSANETRATATPPEMIDTKSLTWTKGRCGEGNPGGRGPRTDTPARVARSSAATITVAPTTATRMPGKRGQRLRSSMRASVLAPIESVTRFVPPAYTLLTIPHV